MDIMMERIQECIGYKHGAKKELAKAIGIDQNVITGWFSGRIKSYKKYAPQIAEFYGVSLDWLSGITDEKEKHPSNNTGALSADENILLAMYRSVPAEQRDVLLAMIEAALKSQGLL